MTAAWPEPTWRVVVHEKNRAHLEETSLPFAQSCHVVNMQIYDNYGCEWGPTVTLRDRERMEQLTRHLGALPE